MAKKEFKDENGKVYTAKEKKPFYKKVWFWILAVVVVVGIYGAGSGGNDDNTSVQKAENSSTENVAEEKKEYELKDVKVTTDEFGGNYVEGVLVNNSDKDKNYVQVQFSASDADGNKIGSALDNVSNLGAGKSWKFKAMLLETSDGEITFDLDNPEVSGF